MRKMFLTLAIGTVFIFVGCMSSTIEGSGTPQKTNGPEVIHGSYHEFHPEWNYAIMHRKL